MQEFVYTIQDPDGIHARPAGLLIKKMQEFSSAVTMGRGDAGVDGKKLFALMKLRVKKGENLVVKAEGEDEEAAIEAARAFLSANL
ncbi:MAG: HPr family phosphocarrier protein [Spirochaetaceae bacterium]|jgi:phosphotransferase system HPr (HPr) family protein|nr:HPr family phosphocarrier protein [Spirochaetaceae bacterium]